MNAGATDGVEVKSADDPIPSAATMPAAAMRARSNGQRRSASVSGIAGAVKRAEQAFRHAYGDAPAGVWSAPGRVNLIGEHTDYNDGYVLPFALPQRVAVAGTPRADDVITVATVGTDDLLSPKVTMRLGDLRPGSVSGWAAYTAGVAWVLREHGLSRGADLVLGSDLPTGAGLSSSAAVECAVLIALLDLCSAAPGAGEELARLAELARAPQAVVSGGDGAGRRGADSTPLGAERSTLARLAQRAENEYAGVPCGVLDQTASLCCVEGRALFLDVRSGQAEHVPFDPRTEGLRLLVIDTRVSHSLGASAYPQRRAGCERAAELLGVRALRDIGAAELDSATRAVPEDLAPLLRHAVTENQRVLDVVAALRAGRVAEIGPLLDASHESLRHDYRVSCPELDLAVDTARSAGALGARMTGGGFGGSAIALVDERRHDRLAEEVRTVFEREGLRAPRIFDAVPSPGAGRDK